MSEPAPRSGGLAAHPGVGTPREQTLSLARVFLARFFDNEITGGTNDLKESFFWLMAFLAAPGICAAVWMSWTWGFIAAFDGVDVLRTASGADKILYLGFGMVATGIVTAIVWQSLLIDRRDAIVLGSLPVPHRIVIYGKLLAVAGYVAIVALSMHVLASIGFGMFLAAGRDSAFALRGVVAHFVASSVASLFVLMTAIAAQGAALSVLGPRGFARVSVLLQLVLVTLVVLGLIALPDIAGSVVDTLRGAGERQRQWILATPPVWFLGIYETMLGTGDPALLRLARTGWTAIGAVAALAALCYPLAYRRVMRDAVEHPDGLGRIRLAMLTRWLPVALGRRGGTRAAMQFFVATIGRVERHRFALALAGGGALAWATPALLRWNAIVHTWSAADQRVVLSLPIAIMACGLVGMRIASSLPADLRGRWLFQAADPLPRRARAGVRRVMLALVVVPAAAVAAASGLLLWNGAIAARHAALTAAVGLLMTEYLARDLDSVPCAAPWRPEHANLRTWWLAYLVGFIVICGAGRFSLAALEIASFQSATWNTVLIAVLVAGAACVHWRASRRVPMPPDEPETYNAVSVLDLN